ncbi:MAG TPA: thioredoxin family protein [Nitrospirota bacterium]|nr:thioredoxin family protein [Nitrospirota bacterium]
MAAVKVFVKDGCNKCPAAKDVAGRLKNEGFEVHEFHMETAEGLAEGVYYGVMSTPTLMVVDIDDNAVTSWRGVVPGVDEVKTALVAV